MAVTQNLKPLPEVLTDRLAVEVHTAGACAFAKRCVKLPQRKAPGIVLLVLAFLPPALGQHVASSSDFAAFAFYATRFGNTGLPPAIVNALKSSTEETRIGGNTTIMAAK
jgi:hypothetical protein